jgi:hypothetical protein
MRWRPSFAVAGMVTFLAAGTGAAAATGAAGTGAAGTGSAPGWSNARPIGGISGGIVLSCTAPGDCSGGGSNMTAQAVIVSEQAGKWGLPRKLGDVSRLGSVYSAVNTISCTAPGDCVAAGTYETSAGALFAFTASQVRGAWGDAQSVPGLVKLAVNGAQVSQISCASAGNCALAGSYMDAGQHNQGWVDSERNATWGTAREVPGAGGISSVSCGAPGNCTAVGNGEVVTSVKGTWGKPRRIAGLPAGSPIAAISCASAGDCTAGADYSIASDPGYQQAYVFGSKNGVWSRATEMPGVAKFDGGGTTGIDAVSCGSPGNCAAVGEFYSARTGQGLFVATEKNGAWSPAKVMPGLARLGTGGPLDIALSCGSAGNCAAGGGYQVGAGSRNQAWIIDLIKGTWGNAIEVPGSGSLNVGGFAGVGSVSCLRSGACVAGGAYTGRSDAPATFVTSRP